MVLGCRVNPTASLPWDGWEGQDGTRERSVGAGAELCLLTNRIPRGELTQPGPSSPQQQPGVSRLHIPFPGKWDLYISRWIQATVIMVGFGEGGVFKVRGCS